MLSINANNSEKTPTYQLAEQLRAKCSKVEVEPGKYMECRPECLGVDDSGEGGLCDVIYQTWSHAVHRIVFQGSASNESVSLEDSRPANEVYRNKRAEMYFYSRSAVLSGQLKGVDADTARELCSIEFDSSKKLTVLQDKHEYRAKHANQSPDRADSLVMLVEVARKRAFFLKATGETKKVIEEIEKPIELLQEVFYEENTYQMEEIESLQ
jgi:hypothetical protein